MTSLLADISSFTDSTSSLSLRLYVCSCVRYAFLAYCCVIVDPPCRAPPVTLLKNARA